MMTAKEARETSEDSLGLIVNRQADELMRLIEDKIKTASLNGEFHFYLRTNKYHKRTIEKVMKSVLELGYECNKIQVDYLKISW